MNYLKGFSVSLILHVLVIGVLLYGGMNMKTVPRELRTVDISAYTFEKKESADVEMPPVAPAPPIPQKQPEKPKPVSRPSKKPKQVPAKSPAKITEEPVRAKPTVAPPVTSETPVKTEEPKKVSDFGSKDYVPVSSSVTDLPKYEGSGVIGSNRDGADGGSGTKAGSGTAGGSSGLSGKDASEYYMSINLAGIRKKIYERLIYPSVARRMGMRGTTEVKFRVQTNGKVDDTSIYKSSGHKMLDDAARKAVLDASPLPAPSEAVYIVLSVSFSLR